MGRVKNPPCLLPLLAQVNYGCGERYVKEEELIEQLEHMLYQLPLKKVKLSEEEKQRIEQHRDFLNSLTDKPYTERQVFNAYVKHVLTKGTDFRRAQFLRGLELDFKLKNGKIYRID